MTDLEKYFHYTNTGEENATVTLHNFDKEMGDNEKIEIRIPGKIEGWTVAIGGGSYPQENSYIVAPGETIFFRGNAYSGEGHYYAEGAACLHNYYIYIPGNEEKTIRGTIGGSILSLALYDSDDHSVFPTYPPEYNTYNSFYCVFKFRDEHDTFHMEPSLGITDISEEYPLILAHNLPQFSYSCLLTGLGIESIPENFFDNIESTTITSNSINSCFADCLYLKKVPIDLFKKFTKVEADGIRFMFYGDTALTQAPHLPMTDLGKECYKNLFYNCSLIDEVHVGFMDWPENGTTNNWLFNVAPTGTLYVPEGFEGDKPEYRDNPSYIPTGWNVIEEREPIEVTNKGKINFISAIVKR